LTLTASFTTQYYLTTAASRAVGLLRPASSSSQIRKEWALGRHLAVDLEPRDGKINNPAIVGYLQRIEDPIAAAIGGKPLEVRVTRGSE
jgi:hypothetical protein